MPPSQKYVAETSFRTRYAETDAMGIVHHASYIVYFEVGRSHYARERGSDYASIERSGVALAVIEMHARYVKPAVYDQLITVRSWIDEMRSRSVVFSYEIVDTESGDILVTGTSKHLCIDKAGRVVPIPAAWRGWGDDLPTREVGLT